VHANAAVKSAVSAGETFFFWRVSFCFFLVSPGGLSELAEEQLLSRSEVERSGTERQAALGERSERFKGGSGRPWKFPK
jgi:hypothetical protein